MYTKMLLALALLASFASARAAPAPLGPLYSERFDELTDGTVNAQGAWKVVTGTASVVASDGHGKALSVAYPYSTASVALPATPVGVDCVVARWSAKFATNPVAGPKATQKLIAYVNDAAGKSLALIFHDGNGQWGIKTGNDYRQSTLPHASDPWTTVEATFDLAAKKYSVKFTNGATSLVLFDSVPFADPLAGSPTAIAFQRNGQGDEGLCYIDDVVVEKGVVKTADRLDAWVEGAPRFNIVETGKPVAVHIHADRIAFLASDQLDWTVADFRGKIVKRGSLVVPVGAAWDTSLAIGKLAAGYYALSGAFRSQGLVFSAKGSQPENTIAFGVLPSIAAIPLKHADDSRFGMQGTTFLNTGKRLVGDPYDPLYAALGARWVNFPASWDQYEPTAQSTFDPDQHKVLGGEIAYAGQHGMAYLTTTHGVPQWAMAVPLTVQTASLGSKVDSQAYPPKDSAQFENFETRMARHMDYTRRTYFPTMAHNWYQTSWEPDWHWKGTPQEYVEMAAHAYAAIHRGDPSAKVLGPGTGVFDKTVEWLQTMMPLGLGASLDGIATHAYYLGAGDPFHPSTPGQIFAPEDQKVAADMRAVKALAKKYLKPGARIVQSEWGLDYKGSYALVSPQMLRQLAAYIVRGHIILLGEGADTTYFFYASDYLGENGFGLTFNLTMPEPNFGAVSVAPKPEFMAVAAMTRVLEGTRTLGPVANLPSDVHAYAFDRAGKTVVALWRAHGAPVSITVPLATNGARVIDFMGNATPLGKAAKVDASEYPVYIEGVDLKRLAL